MFDEDFYNKPKSFGHKIKTLIEREVNKRLSDRIKQAEKDAKHYKESMWEAKLELRRAIEKVNSVEEEIEKQVRNSVKIAQREFWFDCAIGDTVYAIKPKYKTQKCKRCGGSQRVKVIVDDVEVNAECPECGTYAKRKKLETIEYSIVEGKVERLEVEMTERLNWIRVWIKGHSVDEECKYEVASKMIYRTKEEAEVRLKELIKG